MKSSLSNSLLGMCACIALICAGTGCSTEAAEQAEVSSATPESRFASSEAPAPASRRAQEAWRAVSQAAASPDAEEGSARYWGEVLIQAHSAFWSVAEEPDSDPVIRYMLEQIGPDHPQESFRLLFCDIHVMLTDDDRHLIPSNSWGPLLDDDPNTVSVERFDEVRLLVARALTEIILEDQDAREAYCQAALWWPGFNPASGGLWGMHEATDEHFGGDTPLHYWTAARSFVVLAHVTGRDELLEEVEPDQLRTVHERWREWFIASRDRMYWDRDALRWRVGIWPTGMSAMQGPGPATPLPNWTGTRPPSQALIDSLSWAGPLMY